MRAAALAGAAALALAGPAQAAIVDLVFDAGGRFAHGADVLPGKFVEVCGALAAGQRLVWQFDAKAPLDFNIHYHVGKAVHYPAKLAQTARAEDVFVAPSAQDYCWMWTNKGSAPVLLNALILKR